MTQQSTNHPVVSQTAVATPPKKPRKKRLLVQITAAIVAAGAFVGACRQAVRKSGVTAESARAAWNVLFNNNTKLNPESIAGQATTDQATANPYADEVAGLLASFEGLSTPQRTCEAIKAMAAIPGPYQHIFEAYACFLSNTVQPDKTKIFALLGADLSPFSEILRGVTFDRLAEYANHQKQTTLEKEYLNKALECFRAAEKSLESYKYVAAATYPAVLKTKLESRRAAVYLGLGRLEKSHSLLEQAHEIYTRLRLETGSCASYLNEAATLASLDQIPAAAAVIEGVQSDPKTVDNRAKMAALLKDLELMYELKPVAEYVEAQSKMAWPDWVDRAVGLAPKSLAAATDKR